MSTALRDLDEQRDRWTRHRVGQALALDAGDKFALGGIAQHMDEIDMRFTALPSDPEADPVQLDADTQAWLGENRPTPYGGPPPSFTHDRATSDSLVRYTQYREDAGWDRYLALHRHGGVELGSRGVAYDIRELRVFPLRQIVGFVWLVTELQVKAAERWDVEGPYEFTLALRATRRATLGSFAEGWAEPDGGLRHIGTSVDDHVLIRLEVHDDPDPETVALDIGDRVENTFGTTGRRHIANRGEYQGQFDPRFGY